MAMATKALGAPHKDSDECLDSTMDKSADSVPQGEENPLHCNTSIVPLQPGLDESELEETKDSGSKINLSHGSNVVNIYNDNKAVEDLESDLEIPTKLAKKGKNKRKYSEMCSEDIGGSAKGNLDVKMGNVISKKRKEMNATDRNLKAPSLPTAHGDNTNNNQIKEISKRMKELKAEDNRDVPNPLNTSYSSVCSIRSPKILNAVRRSVSVRDTFTEEESFNFQPKASISAVIAI